MPGSINDFRASFVTELARPNRFDVLIPVTDALKNKLNDLGIQSDRLSLRCESTQLPSRSFSTIEQKFGSNPVEKYPYETLYNDVEMTFIVSGNMNERKFFDSWMDIISPTNNYNFEYKQNYSVPIDVIQYDLTNEPSYTITLFDAYPISVNQLDLDWSSDNYHKLTVVFAYTYWKEIVPTVTVVQL